MKKTVSITNITIFELKGELVNLIRIRAAQEGLSRALLGKALNIRQSNLSKMYTSGGMSTTLDLLFSYCQILNIDVKITMDSRQLLLF